MSEEDEIVFKEELARTTFFFAFIGSMIVIGLLNTFGVEVPGVIIQILVLTCVIIFALWVLVHQSRKKDRRNYLHCQYFFYTYQRLERFVS